MKSNIPVNLNNDQMKNIRNEVWRTLANDTAKLRIVKRRLMGCIFNLESTPYDCTLTAKELFFSIVKEANAEDLFPPYLVTKEDMNGKRKKTTDTNDKRKPAMIVHFSSEQCC